MSSMFQRFAKTFQKGDVIFCEFEPGDTFYLIQTGRVEIVKIMGDLQKTVDILQPGELFGEMAILEEAPRSATAIALDKVTALEFNRENFEILMQGNPQIAMKLLKTFTKRIYDQKRRFMILTLQDPEARVADVFLMLAEQQPRGDDAADGRNVAIHATVEDIAGWAAMPADKCRNVINHFVSQRRLEVMPDKILIRNLNDFQRFVASRRRSTDD